MNFPLRMEFTSGAGDTYSTIQAGGCLELTTLQSGSGVPPTAGKGGEEES